MRTALTLAALTLAAAAAWGGGLQIIPISPGDGQVLSLGDDLAVKLRTAPGALCYADIRVAGGAAFTHKGAERAGGDGIISWAADQISTVGTREITAYCALNGEHAQRRWTFLVQ
jgi:hypothetical protein